MVERPKYKIIGIYAYGKKRHFRGAFCNLMINNVLRLRVSLNLFNQIDSEVMYFTPSKWYKIFEHDSVRLDVEPKRRRKKILLFPIIVS